MSPKAPHPIRVLVVDDEPDFATALTARLQRRGFLADAAFSGPEALERLDRSSHDVVILDLKMPGMDELAVLREVRRRDEAARVVVLSEHGTVSSGIEGDAGGRGFIRMPALVYLIGCPTLVAVGTDLFEVMITGAYGAFTYGVKGRVELLAAIWMLLGAAVGAQMGTVAVKYVRGYSIRLLFAITIFIACVSVLTKQLDRQLTSSILILVAGIAISGVILTLLVRGIGKERMERPEARGASGRDTGHDHAEPHRFAVRRDGGRLLRGAARHQGTVVQVDTAARVLVVRDERPRQAEITFSFAGAEVGVVPSAGDVLRLTWKERDGRNVASRVMNLTRQDEIKAGKK